MSCRFRNLTQTTIAAGSDVPLADAGSYFTTDNVEGATQEIGAQLAQSMNYLMQTGKKYKIVACVIQNPGEGWVFIDNSTHAKLNCDAISQTTSSITITFPFTASKILSFVATADDVYVKNGLLIGASVGTTSAVLKLSLSLPIGGYVYYNTGTSAWVVPTGMSAAFNAGTLTITHPAIGNGAIGSVAGRDGAIATLGSIGSTTTQIKFYDYAGSLITTEGASMKCFFSRTPSAFNIDPAILTEATGNIWCFGIFEVE